MSAEPTPAPAPAPEPAPTPEPEKKPDGDKTPAPAAVEPDKTAAKMNVFQKAGAMLRDKAELLGEIETLKGQVSRIPDLESQLASANARIKEFEASEAELNATIEKLGKEKKTIEQSAADKIAALGFEPTKLPAAESEAADRETPTSLEDFNEKLNAIEDKDARAKFYSKFAKKFGL